MFYVFNTDITKVDWNVSYFAMVVHVCCKRIFPVFRLFFRRICCKCVYLNVAYVSYICFIHMLQVFYLYVRCCVMFAIVFKCF
jgi:hypothetical protein